MKMGRIMVISVHRSPTPSGAPNEDCHNPLLGAPREVGLPWGYNAHFISLHSSSPNT